MDNKLFNRIHTNLYDEILKGKFRPTLPKYNDTKQLQNLFSEAQTLKIVFNSDISLKYMDEVPDMREYGFKLPEHFTYTIHEVKKNATWELTIIPLNHYKLRENINVPIYPTQKARDFSQLICDEFERIKIRAEYALDVVDSMSRYKQYATKNITKARKMHHDARILITKLQQEKNTECVFILFVLDLFIIQTILLYQKMFKPYLESPPESEYELKTELFSIAFSGHPGFITGEWNEEKSQPANTELQNEPLYSHCAASKKKSYSQQQGFQESNITTNYNSDLKKSHGGLSEVCERSNAEYGSESGETSISEREAYPKYKWNGQINVLADIFVRLTEKKMPDGMPLLPMDCRDLQQFLMRNFTDKNGHSLSEHTLRTILNPKRTDKKIHPDSPKKIDISDLI